MWLFARGRYQLALLTQDYCPQIYLTEQFMNDIGFDIKHYSVADISKIDKHINCHPYFCIRVPYYISHYNPVFCRQRFESHRRHRTAVKKSTKQRWL